MGKKEKHFFFFFKRKTKDPTMARYNSGYRLKTKKTKENNLMFDQIVTFVIEYTDR